jgi:DNA-binding response OmpR family regulator
VQGTRILLCDDDRQTRWSLATVLRRDGLQVTEAADGEEGIRFLLRSQFELLITDVCMPGLGGFGLYAAIRFGETPELAWAHQMPVIFMSGQAPPRELAQALDSGVDDFLQKPCDPEEFKARVRAAVRRAKIIKGPRARTHGDIADFGVGALAQAFHLSGRTGRVRIQGGSHSAFLDFRRGQVTHAQFEDVGSEFKGTDAALRALSIEDGIFEVEPVPDAAPRTIFEETPALLLRAAALRDERRKLEEPTTDPVVHSVPPARHSA